MSKTSRRGGGPSFQGGTEPFSIFRGALDNFSNFRRGEIGVFLDFSYFYKYGHWTSISDLPTSTFLAPALLAVPGALEVVSVSE